MELTTKPMVSVAAHNSSDEDKAAADFVCDGINDHITINEALARGPVEVAEGYYNIAGELDSNDIRVKGLPRDH